MHEGMLNACLRSILGITDMHSTLLTSHKKSNAGIKLVLGVGE